MQTFKEPPQDKARRVEPGQGGEGGRLAVEEVGVSSGQVLVVGKAGWIGAVWSVQQLLGILL